MMRKLWTSRSTVGLLLAISLSVWNAVAARADQDLSRTAIQRDFQIPLLDRAVASVRQNPKFYPHAMGMQPIADVARWFRQENRMSGIDNRHMRTAWADLPIAEQKQFKALVEKARIELHFNPIEPLVPDIWKEAHANADLDVMCCGGGCHFWMYTDAAASGTLSISSVKNNCGMEVRLPESFLKSLPIDKRTPLYDMFGYTDPGCKGQLQISAKSPRGLRLRLPETKEEMKINQVYSELFKLLNPVQTYGKSSKENCDV